MQFSYYYAGQGMKEGSNEQGQYPTLLAIFRVLVMNKLGRWNCTLRI